MLFAIGAVVALGFAVLSPFVLPRFLGEEWRPVSVIAQIMSLVAASRILTTPTRGVFRVLGLARQLAVVELFRIACLGLAIGIVFILNSSFTPSLMLIYGAIVLSDLGLWALGLKAVKSKQ